MAPSLHKISTIENTEPGKLIPYTAIAGCIALIVLSFTGGTAPKEEEVIEEEVEVEEE